MREAEVLFIDIANKSLTINMWKLWSGTK